MYEYVNPHQTHIIHKQTRILLISTILERPTNKLGILSCPATLLDGPELTLLFRLTYIYVYIKDLDELYLQNNYYMNYGIK